MIQTTLLGRLGADPETKKIADGKTLTSVRVAADTFAKGEKRTVWVRAAVFGKRGEAMAAHVKKGDQIMLTGNLYVDEYEKDGQRRYSVELANADFSFIAGAKTGTTATSTPEDLPF
jgi:single-strand DNA-binding protein